MLDFINDPYQIEHITEDDTRQPHFYVFKNFFGLIMRDDRNKNAFIKGPHVIYYSEGYLKKMMTEHACYHILMKLSRSIDAICVGMEGREHIQKYYHDSILKYRLNAFHEDYDVERHEFVEPHLKGYDIRSGYVCTMCGILNQVKETTKALIFTKIKITTKDIKKVNPSFEGYIPCGRPLRHVYTGILF